MRKALLSIAALALLSTGANAQITLADTSFNNPVGTTDSIIYVVTGFNTNAGNMVNLPYPNHTWDLIGCNFVATTSTVNPRWKAIPYVTSTGYTYAANMVDTLNHRTMGAGTIPYFTYSAGVLTTIAAGGLMEYGRAIQPAGYSISALPGANLTDSIKIPAQNALHYQTTIGNVATSRKRIAFPATMGTPWNNLYQDTVKGTITYGTTYANDPLWVKEVVAETASVVGWGKMRINLPPEMGGSNSAYFNVLQVRVTYQVTDSFFAAGDTISNMLLANLGVTQGQVRTSYYDEYYRPDYVVPLAHIRHDDATRQATTNNKCAVHPEHSNPTSVNNILAETGFSVYPNPVSDGVVSIDIKDASTVGTWSYNIININGQSVATNTLQVNAGKASVTLPANMSAGIYYITIANGENKMTKSLIIE